MTKRKCHEWGKFLIIRDFNSLNNIPSLRLVDVKSVVTNNRWTGGEESGLKAPQHSIKMNKLNENIAKKKKRNIKRRY